MNLKFLWFFFPLAVLYICFYIIYEFIGENPFSYWYSFPLLMTNGFAFLVSLIFSLIKSEVK